MNISSSSLFSRRLLIITGKGGVGKTTLSYALALLAARHGKKVLLAQMKSQDLFYQLFGATDHSHSIRQLEDRVWVTNISPELALAEYGTMILKSSFLYRQLFERDVVQNLLRSIPGLLDYAILGKVWYHTTEIEQGNPRFDLIILDGPSTGHALTFLQIPQVILKTAKESPLTASAQSCYQLLTDSNRCLAPVVTLAEELPMIETLQLEKGLKKQGIYPGVLFINRFSPFPFSEKEAETLSLITPNSYPTSMLPLFESFHLYKQEVFLQKNCQKQLSEQIMIPQIHIPPLFSSFSKTTLLAITNLLQEQILSLSIHSNSS